MYDITNRDSLNDLSEWCQLIEDKLAYDIPILLVGNKLDLDKLRDISKEEVERFKRQYGISSSMEISLKTGEHVFNMSEEIANLILEPVFKEMLEEKRQYFIWIIDRTIMKQKKKFEGKRNLKKQQKIWRKHHFGDTESFEAYLEKQKENLLNLTNYKNEIMDAKELPEMLKFWDVAKRLLNI